MIPERPVLSIEDELVAHRCPLCDEVEFGGHGLDPELVRYLRLAHADVLFAEDAVRKIRRRLATPGRLSWYQRSHLEHQEREALAQAEQVRRVMRQRLAGQEPVSTLDLWARD